MCICRGSIALLSASLFHSQSWVTIWDLEVNLYVHLGMGAKGQLGAGMSQLQPSQMHPSVLSPTNGRLIMRSAFYRGPYLCYMNINSKAEFYQ